MKEEKLLDAIGELDEALLEEAEVDVEKRKKRKNIVTGVLSVAACVCIAVAGVALTMPDNANHDVTTNTIAMGEMAYGFTLNENEFIVYYPIAFDERVRYDLVPEGAVGLGPENMYEITEDDLGAPMGTVGDCGDESIIGCNVYHFAAFPEYDSICILETEDGYAFYTANWIDVPDDIGTFSNVAIDTYGLPDSLATMEIQLPDQTTLYTVTDQATIDAVFALLRDHENSGLEANERRFAQAWYDVYGNDDVYFDEEQGCVCFRATEAELNPPPTQTYTDENGTTIVVQENSTGPSNYDLAREIWDEGERLIAMTTDRGFSFYIDYFPSIRTFIWANGYYEMTDTEVAQLNELLGIE